MRFIRVFGMLAVAACASVPAPPPSPSPERATVDAVLHSPEFGSLLHNLPDSTWLSSEFHRPGEVIPLAETTLHVQSDPGQWEPPPGAASIRRVVVVQAWADSAIVGHRIVRLELLEGPSATPTVHRRSVLGVPATPGRDLALRVVRAMGIVGVLARAPEACNPGRYET